MCKSIILMVMLWGIFAIPAHAQQSPMVQCRIGSFVQIMPDYACDAIVAGAAKIRPDAPYAEQQASIKACAIESARQLSATWPQTVNACMDVFRAMLRDKAICRSQGNC